ncbi:hypothetical protein ACIP5Y_19670 [Nocardia sp. NPDC088792]|uniref:hypothetical protein n=1 Tax=Nocardia sp. NPDC088792 TaxID=3364332 RepID=UPI0037F6E594
MGFWTKPVFLAGVVGIGVPVAAAAVVASLTIRPDEPSPVAAPGTTTAAPAGESPAPGSAVMANPVGFQPESLYFSTAMEGWVTGHDLPCATAVCATVQHTSDGGRTWQRVDNPATLLGGEDAHRRLVYAEGPNRWVASEQGLFTTHDDGATWRNATPPDLVGSHWSASAGDDTIRVVDVTEGRMRLHTTSAEDESWTETNIPSDIGGGPDPSPALQVMGNRAWVVVDNRGESGARLTDGVWKIWKLPCGGNGPADWHAASPTRMIALCGRLGPYSDDAPTLRLLTSADGGADFTETAQLWPTIPRSSVLIPADSEHLVAGVENHVLTSSDGGETWNTTYSGDDAERVDNGWFPATTTGFALLTRPGADRAPTRMLVTHDAGSTWTPVTFG